MSNRAYAQYSISDIRDGMDGVGILSIEEQYCTTTTSTTPDELYTGWGPAQPVYSDNIYIWTRSKITWDNDTNDPNHITYTQPIRANTYKSLYTDVINKILDIATEDENGNWSLTQGVIENTYAYTDPNTSQPVSLSQIGASITTSKNGILQTVGTTYATQTSLNSEINARKATYVTCSTPEGTNPKVGVCSNFELYNGAVITCLFTNANTIQNPTLNVNSTGNIAIKASNGGDLSQAQYEWSAGSSFTLVYVEQDASHKYWRLQDSNVLTRFKSNETIMEQTANNVLIKATENDTTAAAGGQHLIESLINVAPQGITISAGHLPDEVKNDKYISDITSDGIFVHRALSGYNGNQPTNSNAYGVHISNDIKIIQGGKSVASYGDNIILGKKTGSSNNYARAVFNDHSMQLFGENQTFSYFNVKDLRNNGVFTSTLSFIIETLPSQDISCLTSYNINSITSIKINNNNITTTSAYSKTNDKTITIASSLFEQAPSTVEIIYTTTDMIPALTFGTRKDNSFVGSYSFSNGLAVLASGAYSHSEGLSTTASGLCSYAGGAYTIASGRESHAEGYNTKALGLLSHALGFSTISNGHSSHSEGNSSYAGGFYSHAEGGSTTALGYSSHVEGDSTITTGSTSHAEGKSSFAWGVYSHAEGAYTIAYGTSSHVLNGINSSYIINLTGSQNATTYTVNNNITITSQNFKYAYIRTSDIDVIYFVTDYTTNNDNKILTITLNTTLSANAAISNEEYTLRISNIAYGDNSHAEGYNTVAKGDGSHSLGFQTLSLEDYCHTEGSKTIASGDSSHAEGAETQALSLASHAEGYKTIATGGVSHAEGFLTIAFMGSHALGQFSIANGYSCHAEGGTERVVSTVRLTGSANATSYTVNSVSGSLTKNNYLYSYIKDSDKIYFVINYTVSESTLTNLQFNKTLSDTAISSKIYTLISSNVAFGGYSHSLGQRTRAIGYFSHALGYETYAGNLAAHALGSQTQALGSGTHAEGIGTIAYGDGSHAEGLGSSSSVAAHALGQVTSATGYGSHAEGIYSASNGLYSHAQNEYTIANGMDQTVIGKYNIIQGTNSSIANTDYAFIIGNGTSSTRSNALTVDWNGNLKCNSIRSGTITGLSVAANAYKDYTVTFTPDPAFTSTPIVTATLVSDSTAPTLGRVTCSVHTITTTGFKIRVFNSDTSSRAPYLNWIAVLTGNPNS